MISSVEIKGLRGIQEGKLENFTPLVVLVGPNGCGKSTILDALDIGASNTVGNAILASVLRRPGIKHGARWLLWRLGKDGSTTVTVTTKNASKRLVELQLDTFDASRYGDDVYIQGIERIIALSPTTDLPQGIDGNAKPSMAEVNFYVEMNGDLSGYVRDSTKLLAGVSNVTFVDSAEKNVPLHKLYTKAIEQGRRQEAKSLISDVIPGIEDVEILTEDNTPLLYLVSKDYGVPAVLAGDGIQVLLKLSLELASHSAGTVLLEEPEVHQHPGAIRQSARAIWAAIRRGLQVIISTHSLELIDALVFEVQNEEELNQMSVYRLLLVEGCLRSSRTAGSDIAFVRATIGEDLR